MDRLTERDFKFTSDYVVQQIQAFPIAQCLSRLQEYENADEQGMLIRLPCDDCKNRWHLGHSTPIETYDPCGNCGYNTSQFLFNNNYEKDKG